MSDARPWRDRRLLAGLLASWRADLVGRGLFRADGGPGWTGLLLAGDQRPGVYLFARSGAPLLFDWRGPLPPPLPDALERRRSEALTAHLDGYRLETLGLLPADAVVAMAWRHRSGSKTKILLHQLFGPRGNTVLLDDRSRLLWALHRPLHTALTRPPPVAAWNTEESAPESADASAEVIRGAALGYIARLVETELHDRLRRVLRRAREGASRLVGHLEQDLATADRGAEFRRDAETLAVHLHTLRSGLADVELTDPHDGQRRRIVLDPSLDGPANMERYFRRARKADRGYELIRQRLADAQAAAAQLAEAATALKTIAADYPAAAVAQRNLTAPRLSALLDWHIDWAQRLGLARDATSERTRPRTSADPARKFRRYLIEDRWEVWIGRNAAENDWLTHRAAAPQDLWFHAQGAGGSHVILRTHGQPQTVPRRVVAKAAALAALYSKERHASLVPVIWTQRRYVRKPRKSPPGTAACLRHESLFAEPAVPPQTVPI